MLDGLAVLAEEKKITFKIWQFHGEKDRYLLCKEWGWAIVLALGKPPPGMISQLLPKGASLRKGHAIILAWPAALSPVCLSQTQELSC